MTYTHPIWNQQNVAAARAVLNRLAPSAAARISTARLARERDYLASVEVLYGEGSKPVRDTLFAKRMERMARNDEAILLLRRTAAVEDTLPVEFGPPVVVSRRTN
ncbi:MAG TPA: hypothetical protein VHE78_13200 [Gemmatimonadaceae bacterium]|nr:hypothetical protein [Gemmatimonadaceae bacterium]